MDLLRREFVALAAASQMRAQAPIGVAFLGIGHSHGAAKLKIIQESPEWKLIGVAEEDAALRASLQAPLISRDELLRHPDIRVVAVESHPRHHGRDGLAVVQAGRHLHLEKVAATTVKEFAQIQKAAAAKQVLVQTGYMWRYHPGVVNMLEAARAGWLGEIYLVKASIGNELPVAARGEWGEFRGGVMFELGCHVIDPMVRLLGRPRRVTPVLRTDGGPKDSLADNTAALLEWDRAMGIVQSTNLQPGSGRFRSIEIHGTNGTATLRPIEPPVLEIFLGKNAGPYHNGPQRIPLPEYRRYVDDFVELGAAVRGERSLRVRPQEDMDVHESVLRASAMA